MNTLYFSKENRFVRMLATIAAGTIGGWIFALCHIPLPWLLGPMLTVLIWSKFSRIELYWTSEMRNIGLLIIGYSSGLSFTKAAVIEIIHQLPSMLFMTIILIAFCAALALLVSKLTGVDYPTTLTGSIPGGLTQMVTLGEEIEGIDLTAITFLQVARVMMIVFFIPMLVFSPLFTSGDPVLHAGTANAVSAQWSGLFPNILVFAAVSIICAVLGQKVKLPTPYLLGPILGTAVFSISGFSGPALPSVLLNIAQFSTGCYFGLLLKPEKLQNKARVISFSLINGMLMILFSWGLSIVLVRMHNITTATSFLSLAPGGADQMSIIAGEIHEDLSIVTGYQLFRMFFIYFAVPPLLKWFFKYRVKVQHAEYKLNCTEK